MKSSDFRKIMRHFPAAVSIVTARHKGKEAGITISSLTPVSLEPPTLLFCINFQSSSHDIIKESQKCCINLLAEHHRALANYFAGYTQESKSEIFAASCWEKSDFDLPLLKTALINFECIIENTLDTSTHTIFIAKIIEARLNQNEKSLLYCQKSYGTFLPIPD